MQPPGRAMRSKDEPVTSATELAAQLLPIVASRLAETPYLVTLHLALAHCTISSP